MSATGPIGYSLLLHVIVSISNFHLLPCLTISNLMLLFHPLFARQSILVQLMVAESVAPPHYKRMYSVDSEMVCRAWSDFRGF